MSSSSITHFSALKCILRYLCRTPSLGLSFRSGSLSLSTYCDADQAGDTLDRRFVSGFILFLSNDHISCSAKKQHTVSRSSTNPEYRSLAHINAEVYWVRQLLCDLHIFLSQPPILFCDNISALALATNPVFHTRTKHIAIDYHFVREKVVRRDLEGQNVASKDHLVDIFTQALSSSRFSSLCSKLQLSTKAKV